MKNLTMKDIAKIAGVSYTTVSRVLNNEGYVKSQTYAKVMRICKETGYTPNAIARQLKSNKSNTIGIIVPDISNVFFSEITKNIEWSARKQGYNVFISSSFYDYDIEKQNLQVLIQNRVDGIIISGVGDKSPETILAYAQKIPMVFIGDNIPDTGVSYISVDNELGTRLSTEYLLSLGHKRLAFLGGRSSSITHKRRQQGFLNAIEKHNNIQYEIFSVCDGSKIEDGYYTGMAYFNRCKETSTSPATGVICINDHFALGILQAAKECCIKIPEDLSLVGFDNIFFSSLPGICLTTVSQPKDELCQYALDTLFSLITAGCRDVTKILEPSLVIRNTCAPPRG